MLYELTKFSAFGSTEVPQVTFCLWSLDDLLMDQCENLQQFSQARIELSSRDRHQKTSVIRVLSSIARQNPKSDACTVVVLDTLCRVPCRSLTTSSTTKSRNKRTRFRWMLSGYFCPEMSRMLSSMEFRPTDSLRLRFLLKYPGKKQSPPLIVLSPSLTR